jgi:hypothetical protein
VQEALSAAVDGSLDSIGWNADGSRLAVANRTSRVSVLDPRTSAAPLSFNAYEERTLDACACACGRDARSPWLTA